MNGKPNVLLMSKNDNWSAGADMKYLLSLPTTIERPEDFDRESEVNENNISMTEFFELYFDVRDLILQTNTTSIINGYAVGGGIGLAMASKLMVFTENSFVS